VDNPNCDGSGPHRGMEVRVLPFPGGNLLLCASCLERETRWRIERNRELSPDVRYPLPAWDSLRVYEEE
jgi:hypothetical protein